MRFEIRFTTGIIILFCYCDLCRILSFTQSNQVHQQRVRVPTDVHSTTTTQRHPLTSLTHPPTQPIKHVETAMARPNQQRTALLRPLQCVDVLRSTVHIDAREWQEASRGEFQFKYYSVVIANHRMCGHNFARQ